MHSDDLEFDEYGIRVSQNSFFTVDVTTFDLDIRPPTSTGGWSIITGTMNGATDSSGIEVRMLNSSGSIQSVLYRTTNSATTGTNGSTSSNGCPMNYFNVGNLNRTSRTGERSNFIINFIHAGSSHNDFIYGTNHYLSTSGTTHSNRFMARCNSTTDIHHLRFQRWNGASFNGSFKVNRIGASF